MAVVRGPEILSPTQVGALNDALNRAAGTTVELHVRSVIAAEVTREGMLYAPDFDLPEPR